MNKIMIWIKEHIIISIMIVVIVTGSIAVSPVIITNRKNKTNIELNDNLNYELDSEVYMLSIIKRISNGELQTENTKIDTSTLGEKEISFKYLDNKNKEQVYKFTINIVDTTPPIIEYQKEVSTTIGTNIDLLNGVVVSDNSHEEIKATIEGEYDINKAGTYNLKYIAIDSSNNRTEEEFILNVNNATIKTTGSYYASSGKILFISFQKNNKILIEYNTGCTEELPCGGYAETGTYTIAGNKITATLTHGYDISKYKLDKSKKITITVINENTIETNGKTYKWR